MSKQLVTLNDEHSQVVELMNPQPGKWFWAFDAVEENDKDWAGPFGSRRAAIKDAEAFCNEGAIGG